MNPSYYVQAPGTNFPTAEVEAPSSKHARTAYLDYLSRNEYIGWRDRQAWRRKIVTKRMQPGEIKTQVLLDYDGIGAVTTTEHVDVPPETAGAAYDPAEFIDPDELEERTGKPAGAYFEELEIKKSPGPPSVLPARNPWGKSPAMDLSRRSRGA